MTYQSEHPTYEEWKAAIASAMGNETFRASYEAARRGDWGPSVSESEKIAMREMGITPAMHDFSSQDVLDAYRAGVQQGREDGFDSGQNSIYQSADYQMGGD